MQTRGWHLVPVSRAVLGLGMPGDEDELESLAGLADYGDFVARRLDRYCGSAVV